MSVKLFGQGKRRRMTTYKVNELSGVTAPAQKGANAVIIKARHAKDPEMDDLDADGNPKSKSKVSKSSLSFMTSVQGGHAHSISVWSEESGGTTGPGSDSPDEDGHSHPWNLTPNGDIEIGMNQGHTHTVSRESILAALATSTPIVRALESVAAVAKALNVEFTEDGDLVDLAKKENTMDEAEKAALEAKLAKAERLSTLNDTQKAHLGGLNESDQETYLAKENDERETIAKAAVLAKAEADPVIYTRTDGVTQIRKSDGALLAQLAQEADQSKKDLTKAQAVNADASFEKSAEVNLDALPGSLKVRTALVKAVNGIEDAPTRELAAQSLIAGNSAMKAAFNSVGEPGAGFEPASSDQTGAEGELDRLAKAQVAKNGGSYQDAYSLMADQNPAIAKKALGS